MARFEVEGIDDLMKDLDSLKVDRLAPLMLEEAVPILKKAVVWRAQAHWETGDMVRSIKPTKPKRNAIGYYIAVRPTGKDKKGVRNMEKMAYLEFGTSRQVPRPCLSAAVRDAEDQVVEKMQEVFNRECGM